MLQLLIGGRWRKQKMSHLPLRKIPVPGAAAYLCWLLDPNPSEGIHCSHCAPGWWDWKVGSPSVFYPREIKDLWMKFQGRVQKWTGQTGTVHVLVHFQDISRWSWSIIIIMWYHVRQVFRSTFSGALKPHLWHLAERDTHVETVGVTSHGAHVFFCTPMLHLPLPTFWSSGLWKHKFLMSPLWVTSATLQICLAPAVSQILSDSCMFAWYPFLLSCYIPWLPLCCAWWQWQWPLCVTKMMSRSVRIIFRLGESCTAVTDQCSV